MIFEAGALISLPAIELRNANVSASLLDVNGLDPANFSSRLRSALYLLEECLHSSAPLFVVARPEIFTDGMTLEWLKARCGGAADHICLSDGTTVRLLPGFRNHVFFYALGAAQHIEALARFERRAPEIFTQLYSQVNTAFKFRWKDKFVAPQTFLLRANADAMQRAGEVRPIAINRHSVDDSVARTLQSSPSVFAAAQFESLSYVRITEARLSGRGVSSRILAHVAERLTDATQGVVFVLPYASGPDDSLAARIRLIVESLFSGGGMLPVAAAANLFVASADVPLETVQSASGVKRLVTDDVVDFWRDPTPYYEAFDDITVYAYRRRHAAGEFHELTRLVYGPRARIEWVEAPRDYGVCS